MKVVYSLHMEYFKHDDLILSENLYKFGAFIFIELYGRYLH